MIISTHFFILVKVVSKRIDCAFSTSYNDTSEEASKTIFFKLHHLLNVGGGTQFRKSGLNSRRDPEMADFFSKLLRCSSTILGDEDMMCCPFQYLTRLSDCNALTMSASRNINIALKSFTLRLPRFL